jgi:phosphate transport system substrate-binding protein
MKKNTITYFASVITCLLLLLSCNNNAPVKQATDSPTQGTINITVDESFKPVIEQQIKIYEADFPGTKIIAHYKSEADCFRDLYNDSATRMVIVTRGVSSKEAKYFNDTLAYVPSSEPIAWDAITVVVNKNNPDTVFSQEDLRSLLTGKSIKKNKIVFDGLNATSTVRFITDSILKGQPFDTTVVKAAKTSEDVLKYVAEDNTAIGLVGISWIGNPEEKTQVEMLKKVKIAYVKCNVCDSTPYVKPTQASILTKRYPLVRGLYYILKENYSGLGSGFAGFLKYERGQLVFRRAYLGPRMDFEIRSVRIKEKL